MNTVEYEDFSKSSFFQNVVCSHENGKPAFLKSSGLRSVFENLRFRDRSVWTEGLSGIKLRFQISPVV